MYDLQIIAPCISNRICFLEKTMFYNTKNKKVLFHCLITDDEEKDFQNLNIKNVDINLVVYDENKNENYRLYDFLSKFKLRDVEKSPWTLKIDDDCYNNIKLTCDYLDQYDHKDDYYIVGKKIRNENHRAEISALKNCNLFEKIDKKWTHELECCIFSQSAFKKIISNDDCLKLFKEFSNINKQKKQGYTDQLMGAAAKLCEIYPIDTELIVYDMRKRNVDFIENYIHLHPMINYLEQVIKKTIKRKI